MPFQYVHELGGGERPSNELPGGRPGHIAPPIVLPPLPGIWPKPGHPNWPPSEVDPGYGQGRPMPPHIGGGPIIIPIPPDTEPPAIWPPLPPAIPPGKTAILIWIVGGDYHWLVVDGPKVDNTLPGTPQPK